MEQKTQESRRPERISSPEELHSFMRVSSPKLWIILSLVIVLLAVLIAVAATMKIENTMPIRVTLTTYEMPADVQGNAADVKTYTQVIGTIPLNRMDQVSVDMKVRVRNETGKIIMVISSNEPANPEASVEIEMDREPIPLPDGTYDGELVLETTTPLGFLLN